MKPDDYLAFDGLALADLVRRGAVSPREALEAALRQADALDPQVRALVGRDEAGARAAAQAMQPAGPGTAGTKGQAAASNGPFQGVPFLVKDLFQECAGQPSWGGSQALRRLNVTAPRDAEIVARWRRAGLLIFGRTNVPEFGAQADTAPRAFFATRNPWDLARSPGGSSGGAAAAVACGIVPLAGGNDGGGSIRIPAAWCGLFGFKPGRGRTPWGPETGERLGGLAINHVLTRSVRDSAAALDATHGPEAVSPFRLAPPERPYLEETQRPPPRLRIAWSTDSPLGTPVAPQVRAAVERCAKRLADLGHEVVEGAPRINGTLLARDFLTIWFAAAAAGVDATCRLMGARLRDFEPETRLMATMGRRLRADRLVTSQERIARLAVPLAAFFARHDAWLTPCVADSAPLQGAMATPPGEQLALRLSALAGVAPRLLDSALAEPWLHRALAPVPFTQLANLLGLPAMSVPCGLDEAGLPLAAHFQAPAGTEGRLFALAAELEAAHPWPLLAPLARAAAQRA
jgi:amidase